MKSNTNDIKKIFWGKGPCSHAFFYILNREFGNNKETEESASDPFAGGLMELGYQCGMLWGSALAVGAESYRRYNDKALAISAAITATQHLMESFIKRTKSADCEDITSCKVSSKLGLVKFFITGKPVSCTFLAEKWAPEAIESALAGLSAGKTGSVQLTFNCASEVAKKMGASDEEMVMVAGFAGGLGLSGNACGALSAAVWMNTLGWCRKNPGKSGYENPDKAAILKTFYNATDYEILCSKICGKNFTSLDDHAQYIKSGGCKKLIDALAGK